MGVSCSQEVVVHSGSIIVGSSCVHHMYISLCMCKIYEEFKKYMYNVLAHIKGKSDKPIDFINNILFKQWTGLCHIFGSLDEME